VRPWPGMLRGQPVVHTHDGHREDVGEATVASIPLAAHPR
jgi:hypothetical protein